MKKLPQLIGNTPLLEFSMSSHRIFAKLEKYNLTGSIKDRMAFYMIEEARKKGLLKKGATVIEATTGNTGISLAALAFFYKYSMIAVMPEDQSIERQKMMKLYGAKVVLTKKEKGPMGAIEKRNQIAKKIKNSWIPDQFANKDNVRAHERMTAKEILKQMHSNKIDIFLHGVGTGGTLMGVGKVLKKHFPKMKIIAVEPEEKAVLSGEKPKSSHNIQGIGEGFIPDIVDTSLIDEVIKVHTKEAINEAKDFAKKGIFVGFSSGANIAAIKKMKKNKKNILTIFPDGLQRYLSIF